MHFHGSYLPSDVNFLLEIEDFKEISILEKEELIQTGKKHYSEVLTEEMDFSDEYMRLFDTVFAENIEKISQEPFFRSILAMSNFRAIREISLCPEMKILLRQNKASSGCSACFKK
jgi:hypothetical protein